VEREEALLNIAEKIADSLVKIASKASAEPVAYTITGAADWKMFLFVAGILGVVLLAAWRRQESRLDTHGNKLDEIRDLVGGKEASHEADCSRRRTECLTRIYGKLDPLAKKVERLEERTTK